MISTRACSVVLFHAVDVQCTWSKPTGAVVLYGRNRPAPLSRRPRAPKQSVAQVSLNDLSVRSNRHSLLRDDWAILRMKHHGNFPSLVHYVRMGTILAWMKIPFISFGFLESTQCHDALSESRCPALRQPWAWPKLHGGSAAQGAQLPLRVLFDSNSVAHFFLRSGCSQGPMARPPDVGKCSADLYRLHNLVCLQMFAICFHAKAAVSWSYY